MLSFSTIKSLMVPSFSRLILFFICFLVFFLLPKSVLAVERIESFESQISLKRDGSMDVLETIKYDFGEDNRHGIFRYIPLSTKLSEKLYRNLEIKFGEVERDGQVEKAKVTKNGDQIELKIGDPDRTITGSHIYKIFYFVKNAIGNFDDHDELYWNVTGNGWNAPILEARSLIKTEAGKLTNVKCFTGAYKSTEQFCKGEVLEGGGASFITTESLESGEGLSIVVGFPANTFPKSALSDRPAGALTNFEWAVIGVCLLIYYLILPFGILIWYLKHKRKNRFGVPTVNFDIPKDSNSVRIPPAEAGTIDNAKLEKDDVVATIFDLAIRKYVKLVDKERKGIILGIGKGVDHFIEKGTNGDLDKLNEYESTLYMKVFEDGDSTKVSDLAKDFYMTFDDLKKQVFGSLVSRNYYTKNPENQRAGFIFLGIFSLISLNLFLAGIMFWFVKVLNGRTKLGDEMDWKIDGLKIFLKNMSREYKWQADNLITVERYIPYAMALGYIDEFMKQLKIIYPNYNPSWYSGSGNFYVWYPAFYGSVNSGIATVAPSSSSGFGGGGFSGGGGGGGGGGSW